jgi:type II secretory pathway pseudopilin PulG
LKGMTKLNQSKKRMLRRKLLNGQPGFGLIEILIAVCLMGLAGAAVLTGLQGAYSHTFRNEGNQTAKSIAETQMEYLKNATWNSSYTPVTPTPIPSDYTNYTTVIDVSTLPNRDNNLQKVRVTVNGPGGSYVLESYKVNTAVLK